MITLNSRLLTFVIECSEVVKQLQGPHEGLWGRGVHEVEVHQIINAELLELQHHRTEVGAKDFGVRVVLHFVFEGLARVEPEALAGPGPACSACPLLGRGLADGGH